MRAELCRWSSRRFPFPRTIRGSGDLLEPVVVVESAEHGGGDDACVVWQSIVLRKK